MNIYTNELINYHIIYLIGVGFHLPNSITKSSTLSQTENNNFTSIMNTINQEENLSESNLLLSNENKVLLFILYIKVRCSYIKILFNAFNLFTK